MQTFKVLIAALSLALVLPVSAKNKEDKFKMMDKNNDGKVTEAEFNQATDNKFEMLDTDKDGSLSMAELEKGHEKMKDKKKRK